MAIISGDKFFGGKVGTVVQSTSSPLFSRAPTEPSFASRVATDISQAGEKVQQAIAREGEFSGQTFIRRGTEAAAEALGAVPKVAGEVMPEAVRNAMKSVGELLKKGFDIPVEALSNTELFKEASKYPEYTKTLEEVLGTVAPVGEIAGTIAAVGTVKPTVDIAKTGISQVTEKAGSLFKRKASSIDDIATQMDEGKKVVNRDVVNTRIDTLINEGKTGEARALAESTAPELTIKEKLGGLRPDIKQRIQGKPELMQEYLDVANTRNINDTAKSVIEHGGDYVRKSADTMEQKLNEVGGDIGAFRKKVGTYKASTSEVSRIEKTFSNQLSKLNLELKAGVIKQKAGTISRVNSENEIKVLNDLFDQLQIIKQSPDLQRLIDFRNLFDSKINFAKSTRDVSSSLDPFSRSMRKEIADTSAKIVGKSEAKNLIKYSEFMDALNEIKSFTDRKAGGEYLLRVILSGRGGEARKIVQTIKEHTDIDLMDHATMMQITNEMLGNAAQKTLFRQEMTNAGLDVAALLTGDPRGAAMTLFDKAIDRFINPEKILMEAAKSKP